MTGIVCKKNTPEDLAKNIAKLLKNKEEYAKIRHRAWACPRIKCRRGKE